MRAVATGSWLGSAYQRQGIGKEMRAAVLALAFDRLGAEIAETEAFVDNPASAGVSRALGYVPNGTGRLAPDGFRRETERFRMTVAEWRARPRPTVSIEGLDAVPRAVRRGFVRMSIRHRRPSGRRSTFAAPG